MFSWFAKASTAGIVSFIAPYIIKMITDGVGNLGIDTKSTVGALIASLVTAGMTFLIRNTPK